MGNPPSFSWVDLASLAVFFFAFALAVLEDKIHLRKSKPVMVGAGLIWIFVALSFQAKGMEDQIAPAVLHVLTEFAELFLFLLSAISFVNALVERNLFEVLRLRLVRSGMSTYGFFWVTGVAAFVLSPCIDNLTTALVMGTVAVAAMHRSRKAVSMALLNIVVAANAGGAFSPFGDLTTLMIWQKGRLGFLDFFSLMLPSLVNWLVPALILSCFLPRLKTEAEVQRVRIKRGGIFIVGLFAATVTMTVSLDHFLGLPPFLGMMLGLGFLNLYGHFLNRAESRALTALPDSLRIKGQVGAEQPFDIFSIIEKVEWDTLLFFYGILLSVGGLGALGHLQYASVFLYDGIGASFANIAVGLLSAVIDNIPLTFAVLTVNPAMDAGQWLLLTLTVGVGGSLLSIGSAAGVALMGVSKGQYTFLSHLKWSWAVLLGYIASIGCHFWINQDRFMG